MTETLSLLGSTGSIGTQALEVADARGIQVVALAAGSNLVLMEQQIRKFRPAMAALADETAAADLRVRVADTNTAVLAGEEGILACAQAKEADTVLNAIVGIAGLKSTLAAISAKKVLALANKESLVTGGPLVKAALAAHDGIMLPVDSEHSAIFQCLQDAASGQSVKKILLTASGGPFYGQTRRQLENVTPAQALRHPNWTMGAKITIDSATLMNKGLEVIEAVHLFDVAPDQIEILVHRESVLHSAVEFADGAVIGQMGVPDMKLPIQYALTYPKRYPLEGPSLDLAALGQLTFGRPDPETFRCLSACLEAIARGGLVPAAANGANEEAVGLFLAGRIGFLQIGELVSAAMQAQKDVTNFTLEDVFAADASARAYVRSVL